MASKELIFYDLRGEDEKCWSHNLWKTRLALRYKKIPFETVWLTYPDIKPIVGKHCQQDADAPTLPTIQHGDTWVYDSWTILLYLEKNFPDTPSLLSPSVEAIFFFENYYKNVIFTAIPKIIMPLVPNILDERGAEYFHRTRAKRLGMPLHEFGKGASMDPLKGALTSVHISLKEYGPFVFGDKMSYADILLLSYLLFLLKTKESNFHEALGLFGDSVLKDWYDRVVPLAREDLV